MTAFPTRSDPGLAATALVLIAVCVVVAGIIAYASDLGRRPCAEACACGEVAGDLRFPVLGIGLWHATPPLAGVSVPEAAVNKYDLATGTENDVWFARQVLPVQPVAITHPVQQPPNGQLRLGVSVLNRAHGPTALCGRHGYDRRMAVGPDFRWTCPSRTMRVVRTVSASWWATSKLT